MFGNGISPAAGLTTGIINAIMGAVALALGYIYGFMFLIVVGYIIASLGVLMIIANLIKMRRGAGRENQEPDFSAKQLPEIQ